jgi:hypothetical protein
LLQIRDVQLDGLVPTQTARYENSQYRLISFALHGLRIWSVKQCHRLLRQKPIPHPHSDLLNASHSPYSGRQVSAEEAAVRSLVRKPSYSAQSKVDGAGRELP